VSDGAVTLTGELPNRADVHRAIKTVGLVDGVHRVRNNLRWQMGLPPAPSTSAPISRAG
jgi:osmotically-inducible protein OsmY